MQACHLLGNMPTQCKLAFLAVENERERGFSYTKKNLTRVNRKADLQKNFNIVKGRRKLTNISCG